MKLRSDTLLKVTVKELPEERGPAIMASPFNISPTGMRRTARIRKERVVKEETMYSLTNPGSRADVKYTSDERSETSKDHRGKRYRQEKSNRRSRGGNFKLKKYSDPSDLKRSSFDNDSDEKPDWKKNRSHRHKKNRPGGSRRDKDSDLKDYFGVSFLALLEPSSQSSGRRIPNTTMANVAREDTGASFGQ